MAVHNSQYNCNNSMDSGLHLRCLKNCIGYIQIAPDRPISYRDMKTGDVKTCVFLMKKKYIHD